MAKLSLLLFAAPLAAAGAAPALAADEVTERRAYVRYGDLDLASAADQQRLRERVARAASKVCSDYSIARVTLRDQLMYVKCRDAAIRDTEPQLAMLFSGGKLASAGPLHVAAN